MPPTRSLAANSTGASASSPGRCQSTADTGTHPLGGLLLTFTRAQQRAGTQPHGTGMRAAAKARGAVARVGVPVEMLCAWVCVQSLSAWLVGAPVGAGMCVARSRDMSGGGGEGLAAVPRCARTAAARAMLCEGAACVCAGGCAGGGEEVNALVGALVQCGAAGEGHVVPQRPGGDDGLAHAAIPVLEEIGGLRHLGRVRHQLWQRDLAVAVEVCQRERLVSLFLKELHAGGHHLPRHTTQRTPKAQHGAGVARRSTLHPQRSTAHRPHNEFERGAAMQQRYTGPAQCTTRRTRHIKPHSPSPCIQPALHRSQRTHAPEMWRNTNTAHRCHPHSTAGSGVCKVYGRC
jgi:hypothetical protein